MTTEPTTEPTSEDVARALGWTRYDNSPFEGSWNPGLDDPTIGDLIGPRKLPDFTTPEMCDRWIIPDIVRRKWDWELGFLVSTGTAFATVKYLPGIQADIGTRSCWRGGGRYRQKERRRDRVCGRVHGRSDCADVRYCSGGAMEVNADFPALTESEVQVEKARHRVVKSIVTKLGIRQDFCVCAKLWPCPTIRLIAERERARAERDRAWMAAALAETGEKDD